MKRKSLTVWMVLILALLLSACTNNGFESNSGLPSGGLNEERGVPVTGQDDLNPQPGLDTGEGVPDVSIQTLSVENPTATPLTPAPNEPEATPRPEQELVEAPFAPASALVGAVVVDENGDRLGTVTDAGLDVQDGHLAAAFVRLDGQEEEALAVVPFRQLRGLDGWDAEDGARQVVLQAANGDVIGAPRLEDDDLGALDAGQANALLGRGEKVKRWALLSRLLGTGVTGNKGEGVGVLRDLAVNLESGRVTHALLEVNGELVVVPFGRLAPAGARGNGDDDDDDGDDDGGRTGLMLQSNINALKNAPRVESMDEWLAHPAWDQNPERVWK
jgi:sporulation protein YlmC with PRC-barrel domain